MHVMLDLETWGTAPGCAIRSIGAVAFSLVHIDVSPAPFYRNIEDQSCVDAGLIKDPATEAWWAKQSAEAQDFLLRDPVLLPEALSEFWTWFKQVDGAQLWSQGANFDIPILEAAYRATGVAIPWKYFNVRDTRTVYDICGFDYYAEAREGTHHNALDDCMHQIKMVQAAIGRWEK
jgi:inhibitor of KinA sporulation pathway (predicted exonuclease)